MATIYRRRGKRNKNGTYYIQYFDERNSRSSKRESRKKKKPGRQGPNSRWPSVGILSAVRRLFLSLRVIMALQKNGQIRMVSL